MGSLPIPYCHLFHFKSAGTSWRDHSDSSEEDVRVASLQDDPESRSHKPMDQELEGKFYHKVVGKMLAGSVVV